MSWRRPVRVAFLLILALILVAGLSSRPRLVDAGPADGGALLGLTNQDRTSNGLGSLGGNGNLNGIATSSGGSCGGTGVSGRSADMINRQYFSHQIPPCNGYVWNVFSLGAYSSAGENIGWNNGGGASAINQAFMSSSEHRANILGNYNQMGVGSWAASGPWMGYNGVVMYTEIFINGPGGGGGGAPPPPPPPRPRPSGGGGGGGGGGAAPAPAAPAAPVEAPSPTPPTCPVAVDIGAADRNVPAPSLAPDGGQPPCPSPNLNAAGTSPSPAGAGGVTNEVQGADRETVARGLLETVVDQVLRLFLNV